MRENYYNDAFYVSEAAKLIKNIGTSLDDQMAGPISDYLNDNCRDESLEDNILTLSEFPEKLKDYGLSPELNVIPTKARKTAPCNNLLCFGLGEARLSSVFSKIDKATDNMKDLPGLKNVILFADKWNEKAFSKHEESFLKKAKENDIWIVFYLLCDEGLTQIPFLPNQRCQFNGIEEAREARLKIKNVKLKKEEVKYPYSMSLRISDSWNQMAGCRYEFDCDYGKWIKMPDLGKPVRGYFSKSAIDTLLRSINKLLEECNDDFSSFGSAVDGKFYVLEMDGKKIGWHISDLDFEDTPHGRLGNAVGKFIGKCEKNTDKG